MRALHDYQCSVCNHIQEEILVYEQRTTKCSSCGGDSHRIVSGSKLDVFKPQHFEELGDDVPYIESKQQLASECRKRKLVSRYLEESYNRNAARREI